jgi:hypothetical protein
MATTKIKSLLIIFKWDINKNEVLQKDTSSGMLNLPQHL